MIGDFMVDDAAVEIANAPDAFIRAYAGRLDRIAFSRRTSPLRCGG
jgi:hypothetical protein